MLHYLNRVHFSKPFNRLKEEERVSGCMGKREKSLALEVPGQDHREEESDCQKGFQID